MTERERERVKRGGKEEETERLPSDSGNWSEKTVLEAAVNALGSLVLTVQCTCTPSSSAKRSEAMKQRARERERERERERKRESAPHPP